MKEQFPEVEASQLKAALKKGVTAKVLEQNGQRSLLKIFFNFRNEKKNISQVLGGRNSTPTTSTRGDS